MLDVKLKVDSPMMADYLAYLFPPDSPGGPLKVYARNSIGRLLVAHCKVALNMAINAFFDIEFKQYYLAGYELGVQKKDIVTAFIVSRGLFSTDYFDALHKRIYRQSQQTLDKLVKKLINKVDYINSSININGLKDDQNH